MNAHLPVSVLVKSGARVVLIIVLLLAVYLWVPVDNDSPVTSAVIWAALLALVALIVVFVHQTRRINRSRYPLLAGAESLIVILAIFLIGFAFVYLAMSASAPDTFSEPLNRTGAIYFAITVLSTVGFGDITPKSDPSRWLVSAQMLIDIGLLAGVLRLILGIAKRADQRKRSGDDADGDDVLSD
jgi:F0F1-type ATP synthase assembly protein I